MTTARFDTASTIVTQAAAELGLTIPSDVFGSTDGNIVQLRYLLNSCGKELTAMWKWPSLIKQHSFTATAAVDPILYGINSLPSDFEEYIANSGWNQTDDTPLVDATTQIWEAALVSTLTSSLSSFAYIDADRLLLYPDASGDTVTLRYQTRFWVYSSGGAALDQATCTANGDTIYLDPLLIMRLLKLRFAQTKGMDATALMADFDATFDMYKGKHLPAPVLRLDGYGVRSGRFIDGANVSDTGYGS